MLTVIVNDPFILLEMSNKLRCAVASLSLKFSLCGDPFELRIPVDRPAWCRAYETVNIHGDTYKSEHEHVYYRGTSAVAA
jgi:hypothetical protein